MHLGGPQVKAAAAAALDAGTHAALIHFLEVGQHEARAKDEAAKPKPQAKPPIKVQSKAPAKPQAKPPVKAPAKRG
ncbi:ALF repeat-containing protein [Streptomyces clavuligerus]|nr:ALF repeat-containing protein [Streptomyces clavuligerus]